jgi:hypothetical protein
MAETGVGGLVQAQRVVLKLENYVGRVVGAHELHSEPSISREPSAVVEDYGSNGLDARQKPNLYKPDLPPLVNLQAAVPGCCSIDLHHSYTLPL